MIIGITGSSGAGKSTVCEILEKEYQAKIVSADKIAKQLSQKGTFYLTDIVTKFGREILLENGELNRAKLGNIIYNDKEKRAQLNECTFEYIRKEIKLEIEKSEENIIAIDAPLLFEAELDEICDFTIGIISENKNLQIERIMKRDNISREHAISRLNAQKPEQFYKEKCNYIIINNEKIEQIQIQLIEILEDKN